MRRVLEISEGSARLSVVNEQVVATAKDGRTQSISLEDLSGVILTHPGSVLTHASLRAIAEAGALLVVCDTRFCPVGVFLPLLGNQEQGRRMEVQVKASLPTKKRLWRTIVRSKVRGQAAVLDAVGIDAAPVRAFVEKVRSGDPDNVEAQAARRYWPLLMGVAFRRDQGLEGSNALLNYGYTVLRSAVARALVVVGLHPSFGLHHRGRFNPLCLADDVMEPFRPRVDRAVFDLTREGFDGVVLGSKEKAFLVAAVFGSMSVGGEVWSMNQVLLRVAHSLTSVYAGESDQLWLPV